MIRWMALWILLLPQDEITPKYGIDKTEKDAVSHEVSFGIKIEGTETIVGYIRNASPFFSFEKVNVKAEGTHRITAKRRHKVEHAESKIEGVYDDEKFDFTFKAGEMPEGLDKDKFKQMLWHLAMGGRSYSLEADGSYTADDEDQEAWGEVMDLISIGIVRMPDKAVKAGESWTKEWKTENTQKDNGGRFAVKQVSKIEKIEKGVATITSDLTAELVDYKKDPNAQKQETKAEGKIKVVLEVETGRILSSEGAGKLAGSFEGLDENGDATRLVITMTCSGKVAVK